jgi:hypothetical protein
MSDVRFFKKNEKKPKRQCEIRSGLEKTRAPQKAQKKEEGRGVRHSMLRKEKKSNGQTRKKKRKK